MNQTDPTAALRDRIAAAIWAQYSDAEPSRTGLVMANPHAVADAVLAVLGEQTDQAAALTDAERTMLTYALDQAQERIWSEGGFTDEDQAAVDSLRRLAGEAHDTGTQQPTDTEAGPLYPARNTWTFEVCYDPDGDKWHGCGPTYDSSVFDNAHETAKDDFRYRAENDRQRRKFRMVRATTTYTVEVEHTPPAPAEQQPAAADDEETRPLRNSEELCPGFPDRCPNLRTVDPDPPVHLGGIRCGCADTP